MSRDMRPLSHEIRDLPLRPLNWTFVEPVSLRHMPWHALDYSWTALSGVRGSKTEITPGAWKLRVYAGRRPNGTPIQVTKTVHAAET